MKTLEQIIAEVHAAGFHVNNLFEMHSGGQNRTGEWQANLGNAGAYYGFARADNPREALEYALELARKGKTAPRWTGKEYAPREPGIPATKKRTMEGLI